MISIWRLDEHEDLDEWEEIEEDEDEELWIDEDEDDLSTSNWMKTRKVSNRPF